MLLQLTYIHILHVNSPSDFISVWIFLERTAFSLELHTIAVIVYLSFVWIGRGLWHKNKQPYVFLAKIYIHIIMLGIHTTSISKCVYGPTGQYAGMDLWKTFRKNV